MPRSAKQISTQFSTEKTKLCDDGGKFINLIGDWVYYIEINSYQIYKIKTDGSQRTNLEVRGSEINVVGDWIYYGNGSGLYKIKTNGKEETVLCESPATSVNVAGEWVFYADVMDNSAIYKVKTDGTENTKVCDSAGGEWMQIDDGWIYCAINFDFYKTKIDGTEYTMLGQDYNYSSQPNVTGGWIYYFNGQDNGYLYKAKTDGTQKTLIGEVTGSKIYVFDNMIYYYDSNRNLYGVKTGGTERMKI